MSLLARLKAVVAQFRIVFEFCHECGRKVEVVWTADDLLWEQLCGQSQVPLCVRCFDRRAERAELFLRWRPVVEIDWLPVVADRKTIDWLSFGADREKALLRAFLWVAPS